MSNLMSFAELRSAIATGNPETVANALPETPDLLRALLALDPAERDLLLVGLVTLMPTQEDCWEFFEAAAMDSVVHPERGALLAIVPHTPAHLMADARALVASLPPTIQQTVSTVLEARAQALGIPSTS